MRDGTGQKYARLEGLEAGTHTVGACPLPWHKQKCTAIQDCTELSESLTKAILVVFLLFACQSTLFNSGLPFDNPSCLFRFVLFLFFLLLF